ncbi:hypothetical protein PHA77_12685 [Edwardsiella tarda]|uniref:hypothetical protein n=1 Tax=Edwardsiella tarda TaxID=636 RepID=UPI002444EACE|nr:hypothetical protein [Edwardsiella tarda]WGE28332.1 hypothetical protein PHA77_12685 [Edwardsiella tarda]
MIQSSLLKIKKWVSLVDVAKILSISLDEPINHLDLIEFALEGELILSVRFPYDKRYVAKEIFEKHTPMGAHLKESFKMLSVLHNPFNVSEEKDIEEYRKKENEYIRNQYNSYLNRNIDDMLVNGVMEFDYFCNSLMLSSWDERGIDYLKNNIYELTMLGAERISIIEMLQHNKDNVTSELVSVDGVVLRDNNGVYYNLQEKFDEDYIKSITIPNRVIPEEFRSGFMLGELAPHHYFPADRLPDGCEIGMSPASIVSFESKISHRDCPSANNQQLKVTVKQSTFTVALMKELGVTDEDLKGSITELRRKLARLAPSAPTPSDDKTLIDWLRKGGINR